MQKHTPISRKTLLAWIFWILVWQVAGMLIKDEIFFVTPVRVFERLFSLAATGAFWRSVVFTLLRILAGFLLATAAGFLAALLAARFEAVRTLLSPLMLTIRTVPVVSFIILALILFPVKNLAVLIAFLMGLPILYSGALEGLLHTDPALEEMAAVFRIPQNKRVRYLRLPQLTPYLKSALSVSAGLCWKAGIAGEVIGMPASSIGERLQHAKVYLETGDLFAWTLVVVLLSFLTEKAALFLLDHIVEALTMPGKPSGTGITKRNTVTSDAGEHIPIPGEDIRTTGLVKNYDGRTVLKSLDLCFPAGKTSGILAPSGEGKTTLLRILAGLEQPDAGTVTGLAGKRISFVFQEDRLADWLSAVQNIKLAAPSLADETIRRAMLAVGFPAQETEEKRPVSEFSGGMKRRVAILRAVLAESDVLLLDEPFKGLDAATKKEVIDYISQSLGNRTTIVVTHDPDELSAMNAVQTIRL